MTILDAHLQQLAAARTTADFDAVISTLDTELNELSGKRAALLRAEDRAIFGNGDLRTVKAALADCDASIALIEKAITGAEQRRAEASVAERKADIEQIGKDAQAKGKALAAKYLEAYEHIEGLRGTLFDVDDLVRALSSINGVLNAAGRSDLTINVTSVRKEAMGGPRAPQPAKMSVAAKRADKDLQQFLTLGGILDRRVGGGQLPGKPVDVKGTAHHAFQAGGSD